MNFNRLLLLEKLATDDFGCIHLHSGIQLYEKMKSYTLDKKLMAFFFERTWNLVESKCCCSNNLSSPSPCSPPPCSL